MALSDREGAKAVLPAFYRKGKKSEQQLLGASKWSDMQKGRRQDYSTLKAPGFAKDLDPGLDEAPTNTDAAAALLSLSESIGPMPVVCPFDTTQLCESNKVCPTDGRPCRSSRHYWGHAVDASIEAKEGSGVGELGSALEGPSTEGFAMDLGDHFHSASSGSSISGSSDDDPLRISASSEHDPLSSQQQGPDESAPDHSITNDKSYLSFLQNFLIPLFMLLWKRDAK